MNDPYSKLRPMPPTPDDELCHCVAVSELYIAYKIGTNPIYCLTCNCEVPPERLKFEEQLAESIAFWNSIYGALYQLWLGSGSYEEWSRERLLDPKGEANLDGLRLARKLSSIARTYYLWFSESNDQGETACPVCGREMAEKPPGRFKACEKCMVLK